jgi:hypothetical protein
MNKNILRTLGLLIVVWAMLFQLPLYAMEADSSQYPQVTGFPQVVVVSGTNFEMGYQYGLQAAPLIYLNKQKVRSKLEKRLTKSVVDNDIKVFNYYLKQYDPKIVDWFKGISAGCKKMKVSVSYDDLVLMTVYPQELWARPDKPYPEMTPKFKRLNKKNKVPEYEHEKAHMCSSFGATGTATPDGNAVISIVAGADTEVNAQVILVAFPKEGNGNSFISFPFAGVIANNQALSSKFAWVEPAAPTWDPVWGVSTEFYFHYITQYADSIDDAMDFIKTTPRAGVTGNFLFADASGTIKALEANAQHYAERVPGTDYPDTGDSLYEQLYGAEGENFLIMVNHYVHPDMFAYNGWSGWAMDHLTDDNTFRYGTLWQWLSSAPAGSVDLDFIKTRWTTSNWYDPFTTTWTTNDPMSWYVPGNGATQQADIFYPADNTAYILYGYSKGPLTIPYSTGEYTKLKLLASPLKVTEQANRDADTFCESAVEQYYKLVNDGSLNDPVFQYQILDQLGKAYSAIDDGLAPHAYAYYSEKANDQMALYGSALSNYAKAQLYCQMVSTQLKSVAP